MLPHFKSIKLVAELSESESTFTESYSVTGEAHISLIEARQRALGMVDRMFPEELEMSEADRLIEELMK